MATRLRIVQGTDHAYLLTWTRGGLPVDLGTATLEAFITRGPFDALADALATPAHTAIDGVAGRTKLTLAAADTADLDPFVNLWWRVRATLSGGLVIEPEAFRGPLVFSPFGAEPDPADDLAEGITETLGPDGTVSELAPDMANYVINRYDLTGLTGGASTDLDGLIAATLDALSDGAILELFFPGVISARFRLRALEEDEVEILGAAGGWLIICDNDTSRCFVLIGVAREGVPCVWNPTTAKFHQVLATGNPPALAIADTANAFTLPD